MCDGTTCWQGNPAPKSQEIACHLGKLQENLRLILSRDFSDCKTKELTDLLRRYPDIYSVDVEKDNPEVAVYKRKGVIGMCEKSSILTKIASIGKEKSRTKSQNVRKKIVKNGRNYHQNERIKASKYQTKDDTFSKSIDSEQSSCLHVSLDEKSEGKRRHFPAEMQRKEKTLWLPVNKKDESFFGDPCCSTRSSRNSVVNVLPSNSCWCSMPASRERENEEKDSDTRTCKKSLKNSVLKTPETEIFPKFGAEDSRHGFQTEEACLDTVIRSEMHSAAEKTFNNSIFRLTHLDVKKGCRSSTPGEFNQAKIVGDTSFESRSFGALFENAITKQVSLDREAILNFHPSATNRRVPFKNSEGKRAIDEALSTMQRRLESASISTNKQNTHEKSSRSRNPPKKPVSKPASHLKEPAKPVKLRLQHRQDKCVSIKREITGLTHEEEGRILPTSLTGWRKIYSVMTPYMANVVWSIMEEEFKQTLTA